MLQWGKPHPTSHSTAIFAGYSLPIVTICHGPDAEGRKGDLRLDNREGAKRVLGKGGELLTRITSPDPDEVMPPPDSDRALEQGQIEALKKWIEHGAAYEQHWAFVPPVRPAVPGDGNTWAQNPIDRFILHRLKQEGLSPSQQADRYTLIRRVYLDLIGLPPTP